MIRRVRVLAGILIVALAVTACGSRSTPAAQSPDGTTPITISTSPTLSNAGLYQANANGYLTSRGLAPTIQPAQSGSAAIPLLLNGQLQFAAADPLAAILAASKHVPITIVAPGNFTTTTAATDSSALLVKGDGPIHSEKDLEGKTVAVIALNSISHIVQLKAIDMQGGDSSKVKFVELPLQQMVDAVSRGQVDAAAVNEPFTTAGTQAGLRVLDRPFSLALPDAPLLVYIATKQYVAENPKVVASFSAAMVQANSDLAAHPEQMRTIGKTSTQTPPDQLATITLPTFRNKPLDSSTLSSLMDVAVQYHVLPAPIDLNSVITTSSP